MKKPITVLAIVMIGSLTNLFSQTGPLDLSFSTDGKVTTAFDSSNAGASSLVLQTDGKIIVAGITNAGIALVRYNPDGNIDSSFGTNGKVKTIAGYTIGATDVALQSDGRIIVVGQDEGGNNVRKERFLVVRYNTDGTLDNNFGSNGMVSTTIDTFGCGANAVVVRSDGKIIVGGWRRSTLGITTDPYCQSVLTCYDSNGNLDSSFASDGIYENYIGEGQGYNDVGITGLALKTNDQVVAVGSHRQDLFIIQLNTDGTQDNSFGTSGIVHYNAGSPLISSVALQQDGKIIVAGSNGNFLLVRFNTDGTVDNNFGTGGKQGITFGSIILDEYITSVAVLSCGKIIAVGWANGVPDFCIIQCNNDGSLDNSFDTDGKYTTGFNGNGGYSLAVATQADGKFIAAGGSNGTIALARYVSCLNLDVPNFSIKNISSLIYPNPIKQTAYLEYELEKEETLSISLYDLEGSLVESFCENQMLNAGKHKQQLVFPDNLSSGNYVVKISSANGQVCVKVVR